MAVSISTGTQCDLVLLPPGFRSGFESLFLNLSLDYRLIEEN